MTHALPNEQVRKWHDSQVSEAAQGWTIVLPVKRLLGAKSRISSVSAADRSRYALAFASDVVMAAMASDLVENVVVVTDDALAISTLTDLGAICIPDPPHLESSTLPALSPLNAAIASGELWARTNTSANKIAVVAADLPAIKTDELNRVLAAAANCERSFVTDHSSEGTSVLATTGDGSTLSPMFGLNSAAAHRESGATDISNFAGPGIRQDVDVEADLYAAVALGVGPATLESLAGAAKLADAKKSRLVQR